MPCTLPSLLLPYFTSMPKSPFKFRAPPWQGAGCCVLVPFILPPFLPKNLSVEAINNTKSSHILCYNKTRQTVVPAKAAQQILISALCHLKHFLNLVKMLPKSKYPVLNLNILNCSLLLSY